MTLGTAKSQFKPVIHKLLSFKPSDSNARRYVCIFSKKSMYSSILYWLHFKLACSSSFCFKRMFLKLNFAETTQKKEPLSLMWGLGRPSWRWCRPPCHPNNNIGRWQDTAKLSKQSKKYTAFFSEKIGKHKARRLRSPFQKWESGSSRLTSHPELEEIKKSLDSSSLRSP
jgi:hypothetical protein